MRIYLNIGLNNNPFTSEQIARFFEGVGLSVRYEERDGEFNGAPEPTFVAEIEQAQTPPCMVSAHELLTFACSLLTQESIAVVVVDSKEPGDHSRRMDGKLVFNKDYKGERYPFSFEYFIFPHWVG